MGVRRLYLVRGTDSNQVTLILYHFVNGSQVVPTQLGCYLGSL
jgi:hypothetical protein